jgi:predicted alpha/beta-hydrolase family hydrolase
VIGPALRLEVPEAPGYVSAVVDAPGFEDAPGTDESRGAAGARGPALALTHGAGGDLRGSGLRALASGLARLGHPVVRFNLPYRELGRRSPPAAERSVGGYAAAFRDAARRLELPGPWFAGGKSYGGRVASLAVAEGLIPAAAGLVFYGYPLHPPGRPGAPRTKHWPSIRVPCLFLQGAGDPFCDLDLLRESLPRLGGGATLHVVEGGDHSLGVSPRRAPDGKGRSPAAVLADLAGTVSAWMEEVARGPAGPG